MPTPRRPRPSVRDEAFWQQQEARLADQLGQPCCTLSGMCTLLGHVEGALAVVIHGERDCANSFVYHHMPAAYRTFTTGVTEEQAIRGEVDAPLRECLTRVLEEVQPDAVLVLGTCLVSMIGADPQTVVDEVVRDQDTTIPVVYLPTGGLRLGSQAEMADWLYATLASLPQAAEPEAPLPRRVNIIGLPASPLIHDELESLLRAADLDPGGLFPEGAPLPAWQTISYAHLNAVTDLSLYPRLLETLEREHEVPTVEVPLPTGLAQTDRFYDRIADHFDATGAMAAARETHRARAAAAVERFREQAQGLRLALGLRMVNNYRADQLAYGGLGDVEAFRELGFDITLLIQGPQEAADRFEALLDGLGCHLPFHIFPSPWDLAPLLAEGGFDVAYLADHAREEAHKANLPMMVGRSLAPLYGGVELNLTHLSELLRLGGAEGEP